MAQSPEARPPDPAAASSSAPVSPRRARTREQALVLWIAVLASFVSFLDGSIVTVALPAIVRDLGGGLSLQQWVVDAYLITLGALILVAGSLSDVFGRIRILQVGLIGFAVTSLAIALAPTGGFLIGARAAQGIAGALLVPSSLALIMSTFRGRAQAAAIGTWTGATTGAFVIGPLVGGLLTDLASWRWAFAINVAPVAATLVMLARLGQRDVRRPGATVDYLGAVLCATGLGGAVFALIEQPHLGWTHPGILAAAAVGVLGLAGFLWRQAVARDPMMPLGLFRARNFAWGNLTTWMVYGALSLNGFILGVYLQQGAGLTATQAGLASLPITVFMILGSSRVGALAGRFGPRVFMTVGPLVMAVASFMFLAVARDFTYLTQVLPGVLVFGAGLTLTVAPLTSAILGAIEPERSGIASAVNNAVARIAGLVAVALIGTIVGGTLNLGGFHRATVVTGVLLAVGGLISWVGIRNDAVPRDDAEDG